MSEHFDQASKDCIAACNDCAAECGHCFAHMSGKASAHDMAHCKSCAEGCRRCAEACRKMAA